LFDLASLKTRINAAYDHVQSRTQSNTTNTPGLSWGWGAHWSGPNTAAEYNGRAFNQIFDCIVDSYVSGQTNSNIDGDGKMPRDLAKAVFINAWGTDTWNADRSGDWQMANRTSDCPDKDNFRNIMGLGNDDTWATIDQTIGGDYDSYPTVGLAVAMEELRQADASLVPAEWSSGTGWSISQLKTYLNSTLSTAWTAKAQAYDDYQRGVTSSTDVLASSTGTTAQQAAYKQLQAEFEKVKAASGESGLIARLLQGAGQSTGKVIGGASTDSTTQVSFTRAQLQEIAAALGSVRERSLKDNEQDQIKMQKLNGLLTQNIEAMSALVKAFEQLTQSLVQSLKR
jgi:hypothetical protein